MTLIFGLPSTVVLGVSFIIISVLVNNLKKHNKKQVVFENKHPENPWSVLKIIVTMLFKWSLDKSTTKKPFLEESCMHIKNLNSSSGSKFVRIFNINMVFNDDFESVMKVVNSKKYSRKIPPALKKILSQGENRGFLWNDGPVWKELKKYTLKKIGFGRSDKLSPILSDISTDMLKHLEKVKETTGNVIPIKNILIVQVVNILWCVIGGRKFSSQDDTFFKLYNSIDTISNFPVWKAYLLRFIPNINFLNKIFGYSQFYESVAFINDYCEAYVDTKMKLQEEKDFKPEDFVDHFLLEIETNKNNEELNHIYCKEQLVTVLADLLQGGMDTTSKYLELSLMYLILNPEVQKRVQEEIDSVIGKHDAPSFSAHRQSMPYTCATLLEIHRMGSIIPLFGRYIPEEINEDGTFSEGQMCNLMWSVRMDEDYWGDPHKFRPERFLNADNTFITERINRVMPFGAGIRHCPGESVASASSFTFIVTILQKYSVEKAIQDEFLGIGKTFGVITRTVPFHLSLNRRLQ